MSAVSFNSVWRGCWLIYAPRVVNTIAFMLSYFECTVCGECCRFFTELTARCMVSSWDLMRRACWFSSIKMVINMRNYTSLRRMKRVSCMLADGGKLWLQLRRRLRLCELLNRLCSVPSAIFVLEDCARSFFEFALEVLPKFKAFLRNNWVYYQTSANGISLD